MFTFGFMTLSFEQETKYFTEIAKRANKYNMICYRFAPDNIRPNEEKVEGERFDPKKETWIKDRFLFPNVLYDRCFYGNDFQSKKCQAVVSWLKERKDVQFLGYGLPNKLELYHALSQSSLSPYLPNTEKATSSQKVKKLLRKNGSIVLKPINGSQGKGIFLIKSQNNNITVRIDKKEKQISQLYDKEEIFLNWIDRLLEKYEYIIQPYLSLTNEQNQPFDIRALLQKEETGKWTLIGKGVRLGKEEGIISNLQAGSEVIDFQEWIQTYEPAKRAFIIEELTDIYNILPTILEENFPPLFELGIDIGIAKDHSIWILDINSKPGRKVLLQTQPQLMESLFENPLRYARFLNERITQF